MTEEQLAEGRVMIAITHKLIVNYPDDKLLLLNLEQLTQRKYFLKCKQKELAK